LVPGRSLRWSEKGDRLAVGNYEALTAFRVRSSAVFRWLHQPGFENSAFRSIFSKDHRWLLTAGDAGLQLRDAQNGRILGSIAKRHYLAEFHPTRQSIVATCNSGVFEWPMRIDGNQIQLGPARDVFPLKHEGDNTISLSQDGTQFLWNLAYAHTAYRVKIGDQSHEKITQSELRDVGFSPNGRWHAKGFLSRVEIWDETSNSMAAHLENIGTGSKIAWSSDSRYLVFSNKLATSFVRTSDWTEAFRVPDGDAGHTVVFNADDSFAAFSSRVGNIRYCRMQDGKAMAELGSPTGSSVCETLSMSPSGDRLVVGRGENGFEYWDITALRRELRNLNLDWDLDSIEPATDAISSQGMTVCVDKGEFEYYVKLRSLWRSQSKVSTPTLLLESLGFATSGRSKFHEIITMSSEAVSRFPKFAWAYSMRAQAHGALGDSSNAIADWQRGLELFPNADWQKALNKILEQKDNPQ